MAEGALGVPLPRPEIVGERPLQDLIQRRRSVRSFSGKALTLAQLGQLLWASQGVTDPRGLRAAPSAGALYPLEVFVVAGAVEGLPAGTYRYHPGEHRLSPHQSGDRRNDMARAAAEQWWIAEAPAIVLFAAVVERTTWKYGERGIRYVHMEVGHAAQNLLLQAGALGLSSVVVGAFHDSEISSVLGLPGEATPLSLTPVGYPAEPGGGGR